LIRPAGLIGIVTEFYARLVRSGAATAKEVRLDA